MTVYTVQQSLLRVNVQNVTLFGRCILYVFVGRIFEYLIILL